MNAFWAYVSLEITSADLAYIIEKIRFAGIPIQDLRIIDELTARFKVGYFDSRRVQAFAEQYACTVKIGKKAGLFWSLNDIANRIILLLGCAALLLLTLVIPTRIFFVEVEGNNRIDSNRIIEAAEKAGIVFGSSRRDVRSEKVKNALLGMLEELQWAGVNTSGCVAKISVRERNEKQSASEESMPGNIVALRDGVITSCTATSGNLLCTAGQTVTAGEVLISGYTDCGLVIQKTKAEGEVFAQTNRKIEIIFPLDRVKKEQDASKRVCVDLIIGKKRINLWKDSGICDMTCDRMYKEYYAILPGGFSVPVALSVELCLPQKTELTQIAGDDNLRWIKEYAASYLRTQMIAGTIRSESLSTSSQDGILCLTGEYRCTEMIGKIQQEEIGAKYGESD